MRIAVEIEAYGETMADIIQDATEQWQSFIADESATLPHDTEIAVERHSEHEYKAVVYVRRKVENND